MKIFVFINLFVPQNIKHYKVFNLAIKIQNFSISDESTNLHWPGGMRNTASFIGGEMIRRRGNSFIKVEECVTNGITERVAYRTETVVPDGAFVKGDIRIDGGA